jgi:hypothetical protein
MSGMINRILRKRLLNKPKSDSGRKVSLKEECSKCSKSKNERGNI